MEIKSDAEKKKEKKSKKSATIFVNELRARLDTYYRIVVRNIRDSVPKVIGHFLVRAVQNKMQIELFKRLGQMFEAVNKALGEPLGIVQERKALNAQLETLRKAERVLTRDPEITSLIGSTDDELLQELKIEKAEEAAGNKKGKEDKQKEMIDQILKPLTGESASPVAAAQAHAHASSIVPPPRAPAPAPATGPTAPLPPPPLMHTDQKSQPKPTSPAAADPKKSSLFGAGKK